jgi:hypothetical protein
VMSYHYIYLWRGALRFARVLLWTCVVSDAHTGSFGLNLVVQNMQFCSDCHTLPVLVISKQTLTE